MWLFETNTHVRHKFKTTYWTTHLNLFSYLTMKTIQERSVLEISNEINKIIWKRKKKKTNLQTYTKPCFRWNSCNEYWTSMKKQKRFMIHLHEHEQQWLHVNKWIVQVIQWNWTQNIVKWSFKDFIIWNQMNRLNVWTVKLIWTFYLMKNKHATKKFWL